MVSEDSQSNSSIMHQFIISNQTQFPNHQFDPYQSDSISNNTPYPHSLPLTLQEDSHERRLMDLLGTSNDVASNPPQRLSLSLGSVPCGQSRLFNPAGYLNPGLDYSFAPFNNNHHHQSCSTSYGNEPLVIGSSRYLKPAQSLLQEMVSVGGSDIDASNQKYVEKLSRAGKKGSYGLSSDLKAEFTDSELYMCLLKLLAMLEELERRYEEYYHHMDEVVSSFEMISGLGSGNCYTALALQAMSKHFCTLRNAIVSQIRATKQKIERDMPKISSRLSQLSLFDQDGRQNRISLQQIGIMHNSRQAWRPIRGLPETSVTILRAWLFEHFLHPYPNDSEKLMLSSQTGLSKNQVSNWFINARVRLWKPMIEEMYKEEFAESSTESDQLVTSSSTREGVGDSAEDLI
ncbi:bel1-like homeodomain protein 11 [Phtheirospermum japonicum]|uniref:Bel1-like homeodomain protein 11 n=1 Tax=Phtheirospermum japonicum TaxID=374723 RepID=A0A830CDN8_9LAMI|nr:bel1-like homeodomain protein 11 [Phtheirospermum japonicum]